MAANAPVAVAPEAVARARTEDAGPTRIAKLAAPHVDAAKPKAAPARAKAEAMAMLDRKLLSDSTLGDIMARSEEHTSELQSLMRISYAVLCLKKKKVI